jgi:hypothetical protein
MIKINLKKFIRDAVTNSASSKADDKNMKTSKTKKNSVKKAAKIDYAKEKSPAEKVKNIKIQRISKKREAVKAIPEQCFWVNHGEILQDVYDLEKAFNEMDDDTFSHHVNNDKNDFADWVEYVLLDKKLSDALKKFKTSKKSSTAVRMHINTYYF